MKRKCATPGCSGVAIARGVCQKCYNNIPEQVIKRKKAYDARPEVIARRRRLAAGCTTCGAKVNAKGLCIKHYQEKYLKDNKAVVSKKKHDYYIKRQRLISSKARTPEGKYLQYRASAKKRRLVIMSFEEFSHYWKKPCHYCGTSIPTIGLDRVDSSKGYTVENVVPCCETHNRMKSNMPIAQFIEACRAVSRFIDRL